LSETLIPQWLKEATAELARNLLDKNLTTEPLRGFERIKAGDIDLTFDTQQLKRTMIKPVLAFILPYGDVEESSFGKQAVRV
jgi:hypothetical protein